jgi:hypothetical protein
MPSRITVVSPSAARRTRLKPDFECGATADVAVRRFSRLGKSATSSARSRSCRRRQPAGVGPAPYWPR